MFIQNKYTKWYYQITYRAQARASTRKEAKALFGYPENHHILPESLGGLKTKDNMAFLTAREHFICHWLLTKMTAGKHKSKMIYALNGMKRKNKYQERYETKITSRVYARIKEIMAKQHSEIMTGRTAWNKGLKLEGEKYKIAGRKNKGRVKTQEEIDKRLKTMEGWKQSEEAKQKIALSLNGLVRGPMSEEHKLSISKGGKGISKPEGFGDKVAERMKEEFTNNNPNKREDLKKPCPHCNLSTGPTNYKRWHGNNCKHKGSKHDQKT